MQLNVPDNMVPILTTLLMNKQAVQAAFLKSTDEFIPDDLQGLVDSLDGQEPDQFPTDMGGPGRVDPARLPTASKPTAAERQIFQRARRADQQSPDRYSRTDRFARIQNAMGEEELKAVLAYSRRTGVPFATATRVLRAS